MGVDPYTAAHHSRQVIDAVERLELDLLRQIRDAVAKGLDTPAETVVKLAQLNSLRDELAETVDAGMSAISAEVHRLVAEAGIAGASIAAADMAGAGVPATAVVPTATRAAIDRIVASTVDVVQATRNGILRQAVDAYQRAQADASLAMVTGTVTRQGAAQAMLNRLLAQGITGFVDKAGRHWDLESYTQMAVRTGMARAAVQGHADQLQARGLDLVIVSNAPRECPLCAPWENKVLSTFGRHRGTLTLPSEADGSPVRVTVAGSLDEARAAGLLHPNCRHRVALYLPGVTTAAPDHPSTVSSHEDTQRQRAIERNIRYWKRREALALDDGNARTARAKVREWQKAQRDHLVAHPDLTRDYSAEQARMHHPVYRDLATIRAADTYPDIAGGVPFTPQTRPYLAGERLGHVLEGHRHGAGLGKGEFPRDWGPAEIQAAVDGVLADPSSVTRMGSTLFFRRTIAGRTIEVRARGRSGPGRIWTAYPVD